MPDRGKYIEILSKTVKTVKEYNEDTPIKISLVCVEDILDLLKEQEDLGTELTNAVELIHKKNERIEKMLKEQEAKTGHWISVNDGDVVAIDNDGFPERACFCSECKKYLIASDEYAVYGRYCPYCGTKMEGR